MAHLAKLIGDALRHRGFALVDVLSPCVTFNRVNTYDWFRARVYKLEEAGHDLGITSRLIERRWSGRRWTPWAPLGLFYRNEDRPAYEEEVWSCWAGGRL
ncbi:hypothetical protein ODS41_10625 [Pyrobaculum sp. 3827-6]|uniref:hypothetical protein n=1 Tax=Pyrobaculum sp. 3827-6 TaxID=2983604 RepID=UPI0021DB52C5|nr:hypothetical protein [Pyrobaculum sp. 3827-6]MCU7788363.1 hypothetical protein [Pyrobaculum sp. 3827-6]